VIAAALAVAVLLAITGGYMLVGVTNPTIAALTMLLVVLLTAAAFTRVAGLVAALAATLCFNYFFLPPVHTFTIADPQNLVALCVFLVVGLVASHLSTRVRTEAADADASRRSAELRRALFAAMSHDLRTPLTAMTVAATNLAAPDITDASRAEQTAIVLEQSQRLDHLLHNITDMARVDADAVVPELEWGAAGDIVEAARRLVDPPLDAARLRVIDRLADRIIHLDPRLTASSLGHLLENAAQYGAAGSAIEVTIDAAGRTGAGGSEVTFAVRDHGPGVGLAEREQIFERFTRGSTSARHAHGSGLGLAITRGLIAAHHGRVWADNHPEGGAVFTLAVPAEMRGMTA
jgi:two-component system sensor histidine kinase KdpD